MNNQMVNAASEKPKQVKNKTRWFSDKQHGEVKRKSFIRVIGVGLAKVVVALLVLVAIVMTVMYPTHRDYYRRVNATEALVYGKEVASAASKNYALTGRIPKSLSDLQAVTERPVYVKNLEVNPANGAVRITVADLPQGEDTLELAPSLTTEGQLTYACKSVNIPEKFAPADCRP